MHDTTAHSYLRLTYKYAAMQEHEKVTHVICLNHFLWEWVESMALPGEL